MSQATPKLWMAPSRTSLQPQAASPILKGSGNRQRHLQLDGAEGWMVSWHHETPGQAHQAPEAGAVSHVSHGEMIYRQRQTTCCYLTPVLLQMGTRCCLTTSSEVQATSLLLKKRFGRTVWVFSMGTGSPTATAQLIYCHFHTDLQECHPILCQSEPNLHLQPRYMRI